MPYEMIQIGNIGIHLIYTNNIHPCSHTVNYCVIHYQGYYYIKFKIMYAYHGN
jgi:hypothetical protein